MNEKSAIQMDSNTEQGTHVSQRKSPGKAGNVRTREKYCQLNGEIYAILYCNGTCDLTAQNITNTCH